MITQWHEWVELSFLPDEIKEAYPEMIVRKARQLELMSGKDSTES